MEAEALQIGMTKRRTGMRTRRRAMTKSRRPRAAQPNATNPQRCREEAGGGGKEEGEEGAGGWRELAAVAMDKEMRAGWRMRVRGGREEERQESGTRERRQEVEAAGWSSL